MPRDSVLHRKFSCIGHKHHRFPLILALQNHDFLMMDGKIDCFCRAYEDLRTMKRT